nr:uncharacterized protein LOC110125912 [Odocoileus virginianus texanus]
MKGRLAKSSVNPEKVGQLLPQQRYHSNNDMPQEEPTPRRKQHKEGRICPELPNCRRWGGCSGTSLYRPSWKNLIQAPAHGVLLPTSAPRRQRTALLLEGDRPPEGSWRVLAMRPPGPPSCPGTPVSKACSSCGERRGRAKRGNCAAHPWGLSSPSAFHRFPLLLLSCSPCPGLMLQLKERPILCPVLSVPRTPGLRPLHPITPPGWLRLPPESLPAQLRGPEKSSSEGQVTCPRQHSQPGAELGFAARYAQFQSCCETPCPAILLPSSSSATPGGTRVSESCFLPGVPVGAGEETELGGALQGSPTLGPSAVGSLDSVLIWAGGGGLSGRLACTQD